MNSVFYGMPVDPDLNIEIYVIAALGTAGAPPGIHGYRVTDEQSDTLKPYDQWSEQSYWALSTAIGPFPILIHILYEGPTPRPHKRARINRIIMEASHDYLTRIIKKAIRATKPPDSTAPEN